jgi:hypothetical protein
VALSPVVAERLVNGIIDGTYADIHSIFVYRHGALLLEEYFYGFDRDRWHEMRSFTKRRLLEHFGEWVAQAEMSGIRALQEFAQSLRGYALKPG